MSVEAESAWVAIAGIWLFACSEQHQFRGPTPEEVPETVSVPSGGLVSGFALGKTHNQQQVDGFRITKTPVTVAQYRSCVGVGACTTPSSDSPSCARDVQAPLHSSSLDGRTYGIDDSLPVTCVTPVQATEYCAWQRGTLPNLAQWTLAARGTAVSRYSWGAHTATCDNHPGSGHDGKTPCSADLAAFHVGAHSAGASPAGVQDVLLTRSELLRDSPDADSPACRGQGTCAVQGVFAGTIDSVRPVSAPHDLGPASGFRCVLGGGQ